MSSPTNFFGQLLIDLSDYIKTNVPEIRWIDQDFGQLENFQYKPEVSFPAVLIDFASTNYSELSNLAQIGNVTVLLRLANAPFSSSNQLAPMDVRLKALKYYELEQKLYNAVQGYETDYCNPFIRIGTDTENRDDSLRVRLLSFTTNYEDYSAVPMKQKVSVPMIIEFDNGNL